MEEWSSLESLLSQFPLPPIKTLLCTSNTNSELPSPVSLEFTLYDRSISSNSSTINAQISCLIESDLQTSTSYPKPINCNVEEFHNSPNFFTSIMGRFKKLSISSLNKKFNIDGLDTLAAALDQSQRHSLVSQRHGTRTTSSKIPNLIAPRQS